MGACGAGPTDPSVRRGRTLGGTQDTKFRLFQGINLFGSVGPAIDFPLFDAGLRQAELQIAKAQFTEAAENYRSTVLRALKEVQDDYWPMGTLWYELTNRRQEEKTISYAESHDQALVGDQTLIFRLIGDGMYGHMSIDDENLGVERGMALHKMIRLITLATAGHGYLNFMGNEFGHPEWIDFPRQGNAWSYQHARRQWHLVDDPHLKYQFLYAFDRAMLQLARKAKLLEQAEIYLLREHSDEKLLVFERAGLIFVFNFHPTRSYSDYHLPLKPGTQGLRAYRMILDSDAQQYGGLGRLVPGQEHLTFHPRPGQAEPPVLSVYIPHRTALVFQPR